MDETIRVHVIKRKRHVNLSMRYLNPMTDKHVERSTGTTKKREAERVAAKWEAELREGRYFKHARIPWVTFRKLFDESRMMALRPSTVAGYSSTLNRFENLCRPKAVGDLTTSRMTAFASELRKPYQLKRLRKDEIELRTVTRTEASIAKDLRTLKVIARWAHRQGFIQKVPAFDMPKGGTRRMKGRPITTEEFERMLAVTESEVGEKAAESWKLLLRGLWASGLRISEAMALRWDSRPGCVTVSLDGRRSVLAFDADSQKSGKVQLVPMAPEVVELIEPLWRPSGYVFRPARRDGHPMARDAEKAGKIICRIGKRAGVVVDADTRKCASAHDLRRSFGHRWSRRVMPAVLKELMRHASIETTMRFYVGEDAKSTAETLWSSLGGALGGATASRSEKRDLTL